MTPAVTADSHSLPKPYAQPAPSGELGPSKLGIHVVRNNDPNIMAFVRQAQPAVMKGVDDLGFLEEVKQVSPRTITIGRLSARDQSYVGEPEETARDFVAYQLEQYKANPYIDYWEGWNEPDPNLERMDWYARFEAERVRLLAQHGLKAAVGGFAAGVPEMDEFALFLPAIEAAIEHWWHPLPARIRRARYDVPLWRSAARLSHLPGSRLPHLPLPLVLSGYFGTAWPGAATGYFRGGY
ncbi:MAG: hypothetical protein M5U34_18030 [Chloroflexi bacterium]|nr:hypothetical protein [Chloroflexota bacterium]